MRKILLAALAAVGMAGAGSAMAVPCGGWEYGFVEPSTNCRNGPNNDPAASESDLNSGAYFGFGNWSQLDISTRSGSDPANASYWSVNYLFGGRAGTFTLAGGLSSLFSELVVVLADGGGSLANSAIKWSAYLLREPGLLGSNTYAWSYDNWHKVTSLTLFGVPVGQTSGGTPGPTAVPEPATWSLVLLGLAYAGWVYRRRTT